MSTLCFEYRFPWRGQYNLANVKKAKADECVALHAAANHLDDHRVGRVEAEREHVKGQPVLLVRGWMD